MAKSDRPDTQTQGMDLAESLKSKIDEYEIGLEEDDPQSAQTSHAEVENVLGEAGLEKLYEGIPPEEDPSNPKPYPKTARERFIDHLIKVMNDSKTNLHFDDPDPRETNPEAYLIKMRKLLCVESIKDAEGNMVDGLALYKAAVEEERNSKAFRDAVFLQSKKHFKGPKWTKRLAIEIGGPAACGKSSIIKTVVEGIAETTMEKIPGNNEGNTVILVDGGIEREVSQMRQLVLQVALSKGYPSIKDLHKNTKLSIKKKIRAAALTRPDLNLVMPKTFSKVWFLILKGLPSEKLQKMLNTIYEVPFFNSLPMFTHVYAEVRGPKGGEAAFSETVYRQGVFRANSRNFDKAHTSQRKVFSNNRDIGCESKIYQRKYFTSGKNGSKIIRKLYRKYSKDNIYVSCINDSIFVRKTPQGDWVPCEANDQGPTVRISARDFEKWQAEKNDPLKKGGFLEKWLDVRETGYTLQLQASALPLAETDDRNIKVRFENDTLIYQVAGISGEHQITREQFREIHKTRKTEALWEALQKNNEDALRPFLGKILQITAKRGHTEKRPNNLSPPLIKVLQNGQEIAPEQNPHLFIEESIPVGKKPSSRFLSSSRPTASHAELIKWSNSLLRDCKAKEIGARGLKDPTLDDRLKGLLEKNAHLPLLDKNGKLAPTLTTLLSSLDSKTPDKFASFLQQYDKQLRKLFKSQLKMLNPIKIGQSGLLSQAFTDLETRLLNSLTAAAVHDKELNCFLGIAQQFIKHQQALRREFTDTVEKLAELKKQRQPTLEIEITVTAKLREYEAIMKAWLLDPTLDITAWKAALVEDIKNIEKGVNHLKDQFAFQAEATRERYPNSTTTGSFLQKMHRDRGTELASVEATSTTAKREPYMHKLTLTRNDQKKINVVLKEHVTSHNRPVSDLTKLDPSLDPVHIFADLACQFKSRDGHPLFSDRELAKKCFSQAFNHLRSHAHQISKQALQDYLSTVSPWKEQKNTDPEHFQQFLMIGMKAYKNATEQLNPYGNKATAQDNPYESGHYLPSDAIFRLAIYHVDSYLDLCETQPPPQIVIGTKCWDPHYVEAILLYCDLKGYPPPTYDSDQGWRVETVLSAEKKEAFRVLYEEKFKALPIHDKKTEVSAEPAAMAQTPEITRPKIV